MAKFTPPDQFKFSQPNSWPEWKARYQRFAAASKLKAEEGSVQVDSLIYCMGPEAEHIFMTFEFKKADGTPDDTLKENFEYVLEKFSEYFVPKQNIVYERAKFNQRVQRNGESAAAFIDDLYKLSENCNFGEKAHEHIRDRIAIGILDERLKLELQMDTDLTLQNAIDKVKHHDLVATQQREFSQSVDSVASKMQGVQVEERGRGRSRGWPRSRGRSNSYRGMGRAGHSYPRTPQMDSAQYRNTPAQQQNSSHGSNICGNCMRDHNELYIKSCPARNKQCFACGKTGHLQVACSQNNSYRRVNEVYTADYDYGAEISHGTYMPAYEPQFASEVQEERFLLDAITSIDDGHSEPPWRVSLPICGKDVSFKVDSGADVTIISSGTFERLGCGPELSPSQAIFQTPGGKIKCIGKFHTPIDSDDRKYSLRVYVIDGNVDNLLSRNAASKLGFIKFVQEVQSKSVFGTIDTPVRCKPIQITLKDDAKPYCITTARRIPIPLYTKVKDEIGRMEELGIITPVSEATEWCAPLSVVVKPSGNVRICADLQKLNKSVCRERFTIPTVDDILTKLSGATVFSTLDASSGYWQLPLDESSKKLTTFMSPFGRYYFNRLPFGISSASEIFQREMMEILRNLEGVVCYQDDILVFGTDQCEHDARLSAVMSRLAEANVKLNRDKCVFRRKELTYLGHHISSQGNRPSEDKVRAISELKPPTNVTELRRVMGMVNFLGRYLPQLSNVSRPLNELLQAGAIWRWDAPQQVAFNVLKKLVSEAPALAFYDPTKATAVSADASSYGLGGVLLQLHEGTWKPVTCCSRTLTDTERRYSQIEKECLAATWVCDRFSRYLIGLPEFKLITDHKPLVPLLNNKDIDMAPPRIQRMLIKLMRYNNVATHCPGKDMIVADTLSRSPLAHNKSEVAQFEEDITAYVNSVVKSCPISDQRIKEITVASAHDEEIQRVAQLVRNGWPTYSDNVPACCKPYFEHRTMIGEANGLLTYGNRIIIPSVLRAETINKLHEGHPGITRCRERAKQTVWWPGISADIEECCKQCEYCAVHKPTQRREPMISTPFPNRPWQSISCDFFQHDSKSYIVIVDSYSKFIEIVHMPEPTSAMLIAKLMPIFARFGIPEQMMSDNGSQFTSGEFRVFAAEHEIRLITNSPHYSQSNGLAERNVKTAKDILDLENPVLGLMTYRSTPHSTTGVSPAQLLMGRQIRTTLPTLESNLKPEWPSDETVRLRVAKAQADQQFYYNQRHGVQNLPPLHPGDSVKMKTDMEKTWKTPAKVIRAAETPRSFIVQTPTGKQYRRTRRHIQLRPDDNKPPGRPPDRELKITPDPAAALPQSPPTKPPDPPPEKTRPQITVTRCGRTSALPSHLKDYVR